MTDTKNLLVEKLRQAAELEHQFMCQYLYAALSVKNKPDDTCKPYQLEMARRWVSTIYMVARQEMEHLALANNLLRSIGADPHFYRANIGDIHDPQLSALAHLHLGAEQPDEDSTAETEHIPIPQEYGFDPFDLNTIKRFVCMESPHYKTLIENPDNPLCEWCFEEKAMLLDEGANEVAAGDVEQLYGEISELFQALPASEFVSQASEQVDIIQQYDIFVFPVTDHASAQQAIDLIAEQGEGISAQPTYQSHYRRFIDIYMEYARELYPEWDWETHPNGPSTDDYDPETASFQPGYLLQRNPSEEHIENDYTKKLFHLFNQAYEVQVTLLTALYGTKNQNPSSYPYFASALGQQTFAPFMTMIIRTCGEILIRLEASPDRKRVGPNFHLSSELQADLNEPFVSGDTLKPRFGDIQEILVRTHAFANGLEELLARTPPVVQEEDQEWIQERVQYMHDNAQRISTNLRRIYQQGIYKALDSGAF